MKHNIKNIILIVLIFLISNALIILLLCNGFNNKYEITTDIQKYNEVITGEKWGVSEEIFPKTLNEESVLKFKYVYYDPWDANYLAYLVMDYNEEEYIKEIERLNNYGINEYKGYYGVTGFTKYTLIAMESDPYHGFIYAITDNESKIIYVELIFCNYYMDIEYEKQVPKEYLPDGFNA